ncbi:hypothetical protein Vafri_18522 [Volvox africanus]|uniref:AAR2 C-terminal domain-containing protein n=1 Tax=Volvox africanus TaxID=51714 RepID=A0A8J4F8Q9_9CHLO|nr:hypothetical protein Vafri_18522 [Volvox africanus]
MVSRCGNCLHLAPRTRHRHPAPVPSLTSVGGIGCAFHISIALPIVRLAAQSTPTWPGLTSAGLNPKQLTALNMDRSHQLEALAAARWGGNVVAVVGEMQFAFIAFVFGQSLRGFDQWRALVTLMFNCEQAALGKHAATFAIFLAALRAQLSIALSDAAPLAAPGRSANCGAQGDDAVASGFATQGASLVEEVLLGVSGRDCFLRHHLAAFIEVIREAGAGVVDPRIQHELTQLRAVLDRALGWQFDGIQILGDDDDEYAPVVVELGPGDDTEVATLAEEGV